MSTRPRTLYEKIWDAHVVDRRDESGARIPIADPQSAAQLAALEANAPAFGIRYIGDADPEQGIVHVVGPEQGFTLPGTTLVCGDSHTSSHGALGALAFGIGTSEVEHVLATQTLLLKQSRTMEVRIDGTLGFGVSPKDVALAIVGRVGAGGGTGHVIEYRGSAFADMSIEGRLTIANMSIEAGARSGLFAPDEATFAYLRGRPMAPSGDEWERQLARWRALATDPGAAFDKSVALNASTIAPGVTWGTSPEDVVAITGTVPDPGSFAQDAKRDAARKALDYMGLAPGTRMQDVAVENIFIGSCTNSRIEDLRAAAAILRGRRIAGSIRQALVVPGSGLVKRQAEQEGLDRIFMGRQGPGARTHLLSPAMAAAAALTGRLTDVRDLARDAL